MGSEQGQGTISRGLAAASKLLGRAGWLGGLAVAVVVAAALAELVAWYWPVAPVPAGPVVAVQTSRAAAAPEVKIAPELTVPALPPRVADKVRRDYAAPHVATVNTAGVPVDAKGSAIPGGFAGAEVALQEVTLPRLPAGGSALVTREPGGAVAVRVLPKPRPFVELRREWELEALASPIPGKSEGRVCARFTGLRLGRVRAIVEGGHAWRPGSSGLYVLAGARVEFGGDP